MSYGSVDRLFQWEMGPYEETIKRWQREGLPDDSSWDRSGGYDRFEWAPVRTGLCPGFERQTLAVEGDYEIYRDEDGVVKKKLKDVPPPAMPQYLQFPLRGPEQWPEFRRRLNPDSPARFPAYWGSVRRQLADRDFPLAIDCGSLFGWLRNWMGVEGIGYAIYDNPRFVEQAAAEIADCILAVLEKALEGMQYDCASFWEDMAYKTASLISPAHYRRLFLPHYRRITDRLHRAGIRTLLLDSDGNVEELIPCWLEVGINCIYPMEVSAGMEVVALRKRFGRDLLMGGGMDKRLLAGSREGIRRMVEEKVPLMREGGYLPGCDHAMPPDIPWDNYRYYRKLMTAL
jgi:uroporphyrinogen decarboxylase